MMKSPGRIDKKGVKALLEAPDFSATLDIWRLLPARKVINPLLSFLCSPQEMLRWHAVTAAGIVTAALAEENPESARVIIRRFLWQLNDESGGIGWGIPEALGESLARSPLLAKEYARLVLSFVKEDENYLEYPPLLAGALWAVARLAQDRAELLKEAEEVLLSFVDHTQGVFRALALWGLGAVGSPTILPRLDELTTDTCPVRLYRQESFQDCTVADVAREAQAAIFGRHGGV
ncbi:DVU0298 family protein [Desulfosoma sp.]